MSIFQTLACKLNQHQPVRREVKWNGRVYVGVCRHCETPIERLGRRRWRKREDAGAGRGTPSST